MPGKKQEAQGGAPEWMVTFGDMMSLLLVFFISLVSMSEIKRERFEQAVQSIQNAFGGYPGGIGTMPVEMSDSNTLIQKIFDQLKTSEFTDHKGDSDEVGIRGKDFRVTNIRDGMKIDVGGKIAFDRFSAEMKTEARELVSMTAQKLRGYNTRLLVRGHATREPLPKDSMFKDARELSFARAMAVVRELEASGVRPIRIIPMAVGDAEPLVRQAYTEDRRALNRRVEILVTEDLVDDYAGTPATDLKELSDG